MSKLYEQMILELLKPYSNAQDVYSSRSQRQNLPPPAKEIMHENRVEPGVRLREQQATTAENKPSNLVDALRAMEYGGASYSAELIDAMNKSDDERELNARMLQAQQMYDSGDIDRMYMDNPQYQQNRQKMRQDEELAAREMDYKKQSDADKMDFSKDSFAAKLAYDKAMADADRNAKYAYDQKGGADLGEKERKNRLYAIIDYLGKNLNAEDYAKINENPELIKSIVGGEKSNVPIFGKWLSTNARIDYGGREKALASEMKKRGLSL